jgi:hypothetical protein
LGRSIGGFCSTSGEPLGCGLGPLVGVLVRDQVSLLYRQLLRSGQRARVAAPGFLYPQLLGRALGLGGSRSEDGRPFLLCQRRRAPVSPPPGQPTSLRSSILPSACIPSFMESLSTCPQLHSCTPPSKRRGRTHQPRHVRYSTTNKYEWLQNSAQHLNGVYMVLLGHARWRIRRWAE